MSLERIAVRPSSTESDRRAAVVARARRRGLRRFVLTGADAGLVERGEELYVEEPGGIRPPGAAEGAVPFVTITRPEEIAAALARVPTGGVLAVEWTGDRVIPLENLVAGRRSGMQLWTRARTPREVPASLGALEHGADLVVVDLETPEQVDELESVVDAALPVSLEWTAAALQTVTPAGTGDRLLVDTTSLLGPDEGLLVGSAAGFLFHVASEAPGSRFSRPRPFRVNAGSAHSYVLLADGSTRYLSELEAGDRLLAVRPRGPARTVRVGRIKVERRPLVQLTALEGPRRRTVFVQEAESVRLSTDNGTVPVTDLAPPKSLLGVALPAARHLGSVVEETLEER